MRVALTGGATGIGAAIAQKLNASGHEVTAFDIVDPGPNADYWIKTDLSNPLSIAQALSATEGPFDALINNAGLPPRNGQAELVLRVNYIGLCTFLDGMLNKLESGAAIVNTASRAGAAWRENLHQIKALMALSNSDVTSFIADQQMDATSAYNLSKEAVIVMTMARAKEMTSRDLRMNSVSPAAVSTGILDDFITAFGEKVTKNIARAGRAGLPEEAADAIIFLASPESAWIKGQDIVIDGGMSAMATSDALGLT
ncbi:MAG: SDR family oxidoreductase [Rhodobacteraceae bacterium]|nr:SDR family oxidoreductase [Paracoccaceae bacterium]